MSKVYYNLRVGAFTSSTGVSMCAVFVTDKQPAVNRDPVSSCHYFGAVEDVRKWADEFVCTYGGSGATCCNGMPCSASLMEQELRFAFRHAYRMRSQSVTIPPHSPDAVHLDLFDDCILVAAACHPYLTPFPVDPAGVVGVHSLTGDPQPIDLPVAA